MHVTILSLNCVVHLKYFKNITQLFNKRQEIWVIIPCKKKNGKAKKVKKSYGKKLYANDVGRDLTITT